MKRKIRFFSTFWLIFVVFLSSENSFGQTIWNGTADTLWYDATLSSFNINNAEELAGIALLVNLGRTDFSDKTFILMNDIWLNANNSTVNNWTPIGGAPSASAEVGGTIKYFRGNFDGNEHTIYNMYCNRSGNFQAGFIAAWGNTSNTLVIKDLAFESPYVTGRGMMGVIVGFVSGSGNFNINDCITMNVEIVGNTTIDGENNIGSILGAGWNNTAPGHVYINRCASTGTLSGNYVGGISGNSDRVTITNTYFAGTITNGANANAWGGLTAYAGTRNNCYSNSPSGSSGNSGTILTTAYMQSSAFVADLDTTFKMNICNKNGGFPLKAWQICGVPVEGDLELCIGESTTLTASGFNSYVWNTGANTATITVTPTTTTDYHVTGTLSDGTSVSDSVTVVVYPQAVITATAMPSSDNIVHGTVTANPSVLPCGSTDLVTLTITPDVDWHITKIVMNGVILREDDPNDGAIVTYSINPNGTLADIEVYFSNLYYITSTMILSDNSALNEPSLISPWGTNGVYADSVGSHVTYTFNQTGRYHIVDIEIDGISQGAITTYTFSSLNANHTVHAIYLDDCGINSFPFTENFDTYTSDYGSTFPDCYARLSSYSSNFPYVHYYNNYSSPYGLYFYCSSSTYSIGILPLIDTMVDMSSLQLDFMIYRGSATGNFEVGIMTDPSDASTFVSVADIVTAGINLWENHVVYFSSYNGSGHYIAFKWSGSSYSYTTIDDIEIDYAPDCTPATNLTVSQINGSNATISWDASAIGNPSGYFVEYSPVGTNSWISDYSTSLTHLITGLTESTAYTVRVYADCYSDTVETGFTTPCYNNVQLTIGNTTTSSGGNFLPTQTYYNYSYTQQIFRATELGNSPIGITAIALQYFYGTSYTRNLTIYLGHTAQNAFSGSNQWISNSTFTQVFSGNVNFNNSGDNYWLEIPFDSSFAYNGTDNILLVIDDNTGTWSNSAEKFYTHTSETNSSLYIYSDGTNYDPANPGSSGTSNAIAQRNNIQFIYCSNSTCLKPTNPAMTTINATDAQLTWIPAGSENLWDVEYKTVDDTAWTSAGIANAYPFTIYGLMPATNYMTRVRSNCGSETSPWAPTVYFLTACSDITVLPYTENFDSYTNTGGSTMPLCWAGYNINANDVPHLSNTTSNSASNSINMNASSTTWNYVTLPPFDASIAINTLQISLDANLLGVGTFEIGVMDNPLDISTYTAVRALTVGSYNTWQSYDIPLSDYTGSGQYIVLKWYNTTSASNVDAYIDNVSVDIIPTCPRPSGLSVSNILPSEVSVSWAEAGTANFWTIIYGNSGFNPELGGTTITTTSNPYILSNLSPSTTYDIYVRSECSSSFLSDWSTGTSFMTACGELTTLPYIENFDTYGSSGTTIMVPCWVRNYYNTGQPHISSWSNTSAPYCLNLYAKNSGFSYVSMPAFEPSIQISSLQLSFDLRLRQTGIFEIGVMGDPTDTASFIAVDTVYMANYDTWESFDIPLTNYTDTGRYIAFRWSGVSSSSNVDAYLDNLYINYTPTCPRPSNVSASNITTSDALIGWTENGTATSWIIEYGPTGFTTGYGTILNTNTPSGIITGLNNSTTYDVYVQADCGGGDNSYLSNVYTFNTPTCDSADRCDYTFNLDDSFGDGWNGNRIAVYINGILETTLTLSSGSSSTEVVPLCHNATITLVWISGSYASETSFSITNPYYNDIIYSCSNGSTLTSGNTFYTFIPNCTMPTCIRPENVNASSVTTTSANINWTEMGTASNWNIEYGPAGFTMGSGLTATTTSIPYVLTGLTTNTDYDIYVQADCGSGDTSIWSFKYTFSTACNNITTLPYVENFDGSNVSNEFIDCWVRHTSNSDHFVYVSTDNSAYSTPKLLDFHYTPNCFVIAALPSFDPSIALNNLTVTFQSRTSNNTVGIKEIGIMTDPYDTTTYQTVAIINHATNSTWEEFDIPLNTYTGTGNIIAFKYSDGANTQFLVDNINVDYSPTCISPNNIVVSTITNTSVNLAWTERGTATTWNIEYGPTGFMQGTGTILTVTTNPYTIAGLTPATTYDFYVRAACSTTDHSNWSDGATATTECNTITAFPYNEGFENNGNIPTCWSQEYVTGTHDWIYSLGSDNYAAVTTPHGGSHNACFFYNGSTILTTKLISPIFDLTQILNPTLSFWYSQEVWGSDQNILTIYYRTNASDSWTQLISYTNNVASWTFDSLSLPNPSATYQIAFEGTNHYGHTITLDDITIANSSTYSCDAPTNLTVIAHSTTASATWNAGGTETSWVFEYKAVTATDWTTSNVSNTPTYAISGLTPNTAYLARVKALCSEGESTFTNEVEFTTTAAGISYTLTASAIGPGTISPEGVVTVQEGDNITFTLTPDNGCQALSLMVDGFNTNIPSNNEYTFTNITNNHTIAVEFAVGIEENTLTNSSVSLYPNPATNSIELRLNNLVILNKDALLYDMYGKLLTVINIQSEKTLIDLSNYSSGVYFIYINTERGNIIKKFIKE